MHYIDYFTEKTGQFVRWLGLILVLLTGLMVGLRYLYNWSPIALQELMIYLHASLFMVGAAVTLKQKGHVRVDIFYKNSTPQKQALIDVLGFLFLLLPTCIFVICICIPYVAESWSINERSVESSGLPWLFILKSLLIVQPVLLILQGVSDCAKSIKIIRGVSV